MGNTNENNKVTISGRISSGFSFSHKVFGEGFYQMKVSVSRLSGQLDEIPVTKSECLIDIKKDYTGYAVELYGELRSYNRYAGNRNRLILSMFVREIHFVTDLKADWEMNRIFLEGYFCKKPAYRRTPLGREIADILLAVNSPFRKSDYIPCIAWGKAARDASLFEVGDRVMLWGRVQMLDYVKKLVKQNVRYGLPMRFQSAGLRC